MTHHLHSNGDYTPAHCPECGQTFVMYDNGARRCGLCGRELCVKVTKSVDYLEQKGLNDAKANTTQANERLENASQRGLCRTPDALG